MKIQSDQKILVAGGKNVTPIPRTLNCADSFPSTNWCEPLMFWVGRFTTSGALDTSFDSDGQQTIAMNPRGNNDAARSLALDSTGKIVVAGATDSATYTYSNNGQDQSGSEQLDFAVARLTPTGAVDTTFGSSGSPGKVVTDLGDNTDQAFGVVVQSDNRIVAAGKSWNDTFALVRYNATPPVVTTTSTTTTTTTAPGTPGGLAEYVPLVPARLLETRTDAGLLTVDGFALGAGLVGAGGTVELQVAGRAGIPANASAVALNVAVTGATGGGFITVFPCGSPRPNAANLNYVAAQTVPNLVIAKIGAGGKVCLFTLAGTHLVADANGFFPAS